MTMSEKQAIDLVHAINEQAMSQLITIEQANKDNALEVFKHENINYIIDKIAQEVKNHEPDVTTKKGRDAIASLAHKVSKSKTFLDGLGRELVSEWKASSKLVDNERKFFRDSLDKLRDEARNPLTDYENTEKERIALIQEKLEEFKNTPNLEYRNSSDMAIEIKRLELLVVGDDWQEFKGEAVIAKDKAILSLRGMFSETSKQEEKDAELEQLRKEKEERENLARDEAIREEARKKAKAEAEQQQLEAVQAKEEAEQEAERLKQEAKDNSNRQAKEKADAEVQAKKDVELAKLKERERLAQDQQQLEDEKQARENNKKHKDKINNEALNDLVSFTGVDEDQAKNILNCIYKKEIRNIQINY